MDDCNCDFVLPTTSVQRKHYDNCVLVWTKNNPDRVYPKNEDGSLRLRNPILATVAHDTLYHLGLDTTEYDLKAMFGDVKFVCIGGTKQRMKDLAIYISHILDVNFDRTNLTKHSHRYAMYKVANVLCVSHGIGIPSMSVMLQEVLKLMFYAAAKDPIFFRVGTSGGLGLTPGSVVISSKGINCHLESFYEVAVLGKIRKLPATFDRRLAEELASLANSADGFSTTVGDSFVADDFYRSQARLDGPFCNYTQEDKNSFLLQLKDMGVKNIEMEATAFAALTFEAAVRAAEICVTLVDRLVDDQVRVSKKTSMEWQKRPMAIVGRYISRYCKKT